MAGGELLGVAAMTAVLFNDSCTAIFFVVVSVAESMGPLVATKQTSLYLHMRTSLRRFIKVPSK